MIRNVNENFQVVVSTKKTLFGASAGDFIVSYAPVGDLANKTIVAGGITEAELATADHTATTTVDAVLGSKMLVVDGVNSTLEEGDTIEYATGYYGYVMKIVGDNVYLKSKIKAIVASGATINQSTKLGEYTTPIIAIPTVGEYIVAIEGSKHGILVEQREKIVDATTASTADPDAPKDEAIAVGY